MSFIEYCPKCGEPTRHILKRGYYAASSNVLICKKCGRRDEISIPDFMKL